MKHEENEVNEMEEEKCRAAMMSLERGGSEFTSLPLIKCKYSHLCPSSSNNLQNCH